MPPGRSFKLRLRSDALERLNPCRSLFSILMALIAPDFSSFLATSFASGFDSETGHEEEVGLQTWLIAGAHLYAADILKLITDACHSRWDSLMLTLVMALHKHDMEKIELK